MKSGILIPAFERCCIGAVRTLVLDARAVIRLVFGFGNCPGQHPSPPHWVPSQQIGGSVCRGLHDGKWLVLWS